MHKCMDSFTWPLTGSGLVADADGGNKKKRKGKGKDKAETADAATGKDDDFARQTVDWWTKCVSRPRRVSKRG